MTTPLVCQQEAARFATTRDDAVSLVDRALDTLAQDLAHAGRNPRWQRHVLNKAAAALAPYTRTTGRALPRCFQVTGSSTQQGGTS